MNMKVFLRQMLKNFVQKAFLPAAYRIYCLKNKTVNKKLVVFADGHHDTLPEDMKLLYERVIAEGFQVETAICDNTGLGILAQIRFNLKFMEQYSRAGNVILCNYFLPVISCKKRQETQVVQLWHACGAYKRFGYDAKEDLPENFPTNAFKNFGLVTVSSQKCVSIYSSAFGIEKEQVQALGTSRTDLYYQDEFNRTCREEFFQMYPDARRKKIILWAPTFRNSAVTPTVEGVEWIEQMQREHKDEWFVIKKFHPHLEGNGFQSDSPIPTARLLPVIDIMITDYSSVFFDYMIYQKPLILFIPDAGNYEQERGCYVSLEEIPGTIVRDGEILPKIIEQTMNLQPDETYTSFFQEYMGACDGKATDRILIALRKWNEQ